MFNPEPTLRTAPSNPLPPSGEEESVIEFLQTLDYSKTPLGPKENWPPPLLSAFDICLASLFPCVLYWGPEFINIFNQAWRNEVMGHKSLAASFGRPGAQVWPEAWHVLGPMLESVTTSKKALFVEDFFILLHRSGYLEECYFSWSFSPIYNADGSVGGGFTPLLETTHRVLGDRRLRTLGQLGENTPNAITPREACKLATDTLKGNKDAVFAVLYLSDGRDAELISTTFDGDDSIPSWLTLPTTTPLTSEDSTEQWPIASVFRDRAARLVTFSPEEGGEQEQALLLPIKSSHQPDTVAVLVVGVNKYRALDKPYREWFDLVVGHISTALTNSKAREEDRRRAEMLAQLDRAKTAFFSNISHEFRTPLMLMMGPLQDLLDDPTLNTDHRDRVEMALRNVERLKRLVNNLLDYSAIEEGRNTAVYEMTDLSEYTKELASCFEFSANRLGLTLTTDCPPWNNEGEPIYVAPDMWEKIVLNLLSNALKFTWQGGVTIAVRRVEGGAELVVRDTGIGIPEEFLPRLFERFFRAQNQEASNVPSSPSPSSPSPSSSSSSVSSFSSSASNTPPARSHEGTGIGLPLTKELVRLHGGTISVTSKVGEGTCFKVFVPSGYAHLPSNHVRKHPPRNPMISDSPAYYVNEMATWARGQEHHKWTDKEKKTENKREQKQEKNEWHHKTTASTSKIDQSAHFKGSMVSGKLPRILVVDDNEDVLRYLSSLLQPFATVITATDGASALSIATESTTNGLDLILSDVMMPVLDGFSLLRALRDNPTTASIPVILVSARAGQEAAVEGIEKGADDYITKPFVSRELIAKVKGTINLFHLRQQLVEVEKRDLVKRHVISTILEKVRCGTMGLSQLIGESLRDLSAVLETERMAICEVLPCQEQEHQGNPDREGEFRCTVTYEHLDNHRSKDGGEIIEKMIGRSWTARSPNLNALLSQSPSEFLQPILFSCSKNLMQRNYHDLAVPIHVNDRVWGILHALRHAPLVNAERELIEQITEHIALGVMKAMLTEQQIQQRIEFDTAMASNRMKNMIIANTSHELRTPLNAIIGLTELLHSTRLVEEQEGMVSTILAASETLLSIVNDILDFSKMEADKLTLSDSDFHFYEFVDKILDMFRDVVHKKGIDLNCLVDLPPHFPGVIRTDSGRLRQVLINLINNAIKFTDVGHVLVRIGWSHDCKAEDQSDEEKKEGDELEGINNESLRDRGVEGDWKKEAEEGPMFGSDFFLKFEVIDTGIGISKEGISKLFQPFSQVDGSSTRPYGGTGLGLAISRLLVNLASGEIGVQSELGKGSEFSFTWLCHQPVGDIPLECSSCSRIGHRISSSEWEIASGEEPGALRIMVIDQDEATVRSIAGYIPHAECCSATTLKEGLGLIKKDEKEGNPFHLLFLDTTFPDTEDLVLSARKMQLRFPTCGLVLLTSPERTQLLHARGVAEQITFKPPLLLQRPLRKSSLLQCMRAEKAFLHDGRREECIGEEQRTESKVKLWGEARHLWRERAKEQEAEEETGGERDETVEDKWGMRKRSKKGQKILVVEDNLVNRKVIMAQLKKLGYTEVDLAVNGREAVEMVAAEETKRGRGEIESGEDGGGSGERSAGGGYALVLMDIAMPVMDGVEATIQIRGLREGRARYIPIIALTASVAPQDRTRCIECGMSDFLMKPLRGAELEAMLMKWLP